MDWMFYLVVLVGLFSVIAAIGVVRDLMHVRLKRVEEKIRREKEARQIAESNSGL